MRLRRVCAYGVVVSLLGCRSGADAPLDTGPAILPDTVTIDSVLHMRHGPDAFARAPQFTIDSVPIVVIDGGADSTFNISRVDRPLVLPDGRVVISANRLLVFGADGRPAKVLADSGWGAAEVVRPSDPMLIGGDTILVLDQRHRRASWFSVDSGLLHSEMLSNKVRSSCLQPEGQLSGGRLLTVDSCDGHGVFDTVVRALRPVVTVDARYELPDTIMILRGEEVAPRAPPYIPFGFSRLDQVRFSRQGFVAPWQQMVAAAHGSDGYTIEQWSTLGTLKAKVTVATPRRVVTPTMVQDDIARRIASIDSRPRDGITDFEASRRRARILRSADSLPPYAGLIAGPNGMLWVTDYALYTDTIVTATAFRSDGAILARLTIPRRRIPVWFGPDRVMLREVDADGVVRFGIYRIVAAPAAPR